jgi:hypothetical protein
VVKQINEESSRFQCVEDLMRKKDKIEVPVSNKIKNPFDKAPNFSKPNRTSCPLGKFIKQWEKKNPGTIDLDNRADKQKSEATSSMKIMLNPSNVKPFGPMNLVRKVALESKPADLDTQLFPFPSQLPSRIKQKNEPFKAFLLEAQTPQMTSCQQRGTRAELTWVQVSPQRNKETRVV